MPVIGSRFLVRVLSMAFLWAVSVATADAQTPYTVAEFAPGTSNQFGLTGFGSDFGRPGQTFTVTRDGKLHAIRVLLTQNGALPNAVTVEVRPVDQSSGLPTNVILASAAIPNPALSSVPTYFTADFSSGNILLRAGFRYAFSLRTHSPGAGAIAHGDSQGVTDPYAGGARVQSSDYGSTWFNPGGNTDLAFRVTAVPPVLVAPDNSFGAGKLSVDLLTGLDWLSPTLTQGKSPEQIINGFGGYLASGFRFATAAEFQELLRHFGMGQFGASTASPAEVDAAQAAINILGTTALGSGFVTTAGHTLHPTLPGFYTQSSLEVFSTDGFCSSFGLSAPCARALVVNGNVSPQQTVSFVGAMLVRDSSSFDQSFYPLNFSAGDISTNLMQIGDGQSVAQSFTVGVTGQLARVSVQLGVFGTMTQPVRLDVRRTTGGVPNADNQPVLATALIPVAAAVAANTTSAFITVSLDTPVSVTTGDVLAIVLSSDQMNSNYGWKASVSFATPAPPLYPGGALFFHDTGNPTWRLSGTSSDAGFRTYVITDSGAADVTAPALTVPSDIVFDATSAAGAVVTFAATATDSVDPSPLVACSPASGTTFAIGVTPVSCSAVDASGNQSSASFSITVVDTTPPVLTGVSTDRTVEATGATGALVTWSSPTAVDAVSGSVVVTCSPASPGTFPLGLTSVLCEGQDAAGNRASAGFTVRVVDTTAPAISGMPVNRTLEAVGPAGTATTWVSPGATDLVSGAVTVNCSPASGSTFAITTTAVVCSAIDTAGNRAQASFQVTVADRLPPTLTLLTPSSDALITSSAQVTVGASDEVAVTGVADQNVSVFSRIAGNAQSGTWRGVTSQGRLYYRTWYYQGFTYSGYIPSYSDIRVRASDSAGNAVVATVIDNDGIASAIDRPRANAAIDQSGAFSYGFNDGITSGSLVTNSGYMAVSKVGAAIRVSLLSRAPWQFLPYVNGCSGPEKQVVLPNVGDTVDITCQGSTMTVRVVSTASRVEVWKHIYGTSCYLFYGCSTYDYWTSAVLTTGQSYSTGSPLSADPANEGTVAIEVRRMAPTAAAQSFVEPLEEPHSEPSLDGFQIAAHDLGGDVIATAELQPGTTAEISILPGTEPSMDQVQVEALVGTITATIQGQPHVISEGQHVTANAAPRSDQAISFGPISNRTFGAQPFALTATASSGLAVSYNIGAGSACSVAGNVVTMLSAGTCTVVAMQGGSDLFNAAAPVIQSFNIARAPQIISLGSLPSPVTYGDPAIDLAASSTSGLPVSLAASGACGLSGPSTLAFTGWGSCTLIASQAGNSNYLPADSLTRTSQVTLSWSGVLQPINADNSSIFKQGSTVPVKFKLTGASAAITNLPALLFLAQVSNGLTGSELEAVTTTSNDGGNAFRYDAASGQYVFNLGTKGLAQGTWQIRIDLRDGTTGTVLVSLKK